LSFCLATGAETDEVSRSDNLTSDVVTGVNPASSSTSYQSMDVDIVPDSSNDILVASAVCQQGRTDCATSLAIDGSSALLRSVDTMPPDNNS